MRILLDECVNARVKTAFPGHSVRTVAEMGWRGVEDEALLAQAQDSFDVFMTIDRRIELQQDLSKLKLGIVIARVPNNQISSYRPIFASLLNAAIMVDPGNVIHVSADPKAI